MTHLPHIESNGARARTFYGIKSKWEARHGKPLTMTETARRIHDIGAETIESAYTDLFSIVIKRGRIDSVDNIWTPRTQWLPEETRGRFITDFFEPVPYPPWSEERLWESNLRKFNGGVLRCRVNIHDHGDGAYVWYVSIVGNGG